MCPRFESGSHVLFRTRSLRDRPKRKATVRKTLTVATRLCHESLGQETSVCNLKVVISSRSATSSMRTFVRIVVLLAIIAGIGACLYFLGSGDLKGRESALLSIVLTGLSILASWVVTAMYAESQHRAAIDDVQEAHRTNLRTYALKAAEKVTNLSNELGRLSTYLQQELDCSDYRSSEEEFGVVPIFETTS